MFTNKIKLGLLFIGQMLFAQTQIHSIPDFMSPKSNVNDYLVLDNYFQNVTSYNAKVLSGSACMDDDNVNSCYSASFTLTDSKLLYIDSNSTSTATIIVNAIGPIRTLSDTFVVDFKYDINYVQKKMDSYTYNANFDSSKVNTIELSQMLWSTSTPVYSILPNSTNSNASISNGTLSFKNKDNNLNVEKFYIEALNGIGSDTLLINVNYIDSSVVQKEILVDTTLFYGSQLAIDLNSYFDIWTKTQVTTLSGNGCVDDIKAGYCYTSGVFYPNTTNILYIDQSPNKDSVQLLIKVSNSRDTLLDTLSVYWTKVGMKPIIETLTSTKTLQINDSLSVNLSQNYVGEETLSYIVKTSSSNLLATFSNGLLTVKSGSKVAAEKVYLTISNKNGSVTDTISFNVLDSKPRLLKSIADVVIDGYDDFYIDLDTYFSNLATVTIKEINGQSFCSDDDAAISYCSTSELFTLSDLYIGYNNNDTLNLEIKVSNSGMFVLDTFKVYYGYVSRAPFLATTINSKSLNFDAGRYLVSNLKTSILGTTPMTYSVKSLNGIVNPVVLNSQFYVDVDESVWGSDSIVLMATNAFGTFKDTIAITITAPIIASFNSDLITTNVNLGTNLSPSYYLSVSGSGVKTITSKSLTGISSPTISGSYIYLNPVQTKPGIDTIEVKVSNQWGYDIDTLIVNYSNSTYPVTKIKKIANVTVNYDVDYSINLNDYFLNQTTIVASVISAKGCLDDDPTNDCYSSQNVSGLTLYIGNHSVGVVDVEVLASNANYSFLDTISVTFVDEKVTELKPIKNIYALKTENVQLSLSDYFMWASSYSVTTTTGNLCIADVKGGCYTSDVVKDDLYIHMNTSTASTVRVIARNATSSDTLEFDIKFSDGLINRKNNDSNINILPSKSVLFKDYYLGSDVAISMVSAKGLVDYLDVGQGSFTLTSGNKLGMDTLYVVVENSWVSIKDTIFVEITDKVNNVKINRLPIGVKLVDHNLIISNDAITNIKIFDYRGRLVNELGKNELISNLEQPLNLSSGAYLVQIREGSKKSVLSISIK